MKFDEKLEALAKYHANVSRCVMVTITALSEAEKRHARENFDDKMKRAIEVKQPRQLAGHVVNEKGTAKAAFTAVLQHGPLDKDALRVALKQRGVSLASIGTMLRHRVVKRVSGGRYALAGQARNGNGAKTAHKAASGPRLKKGMFSATVVGLVRAEGGTMPRATLRAVAKERGWSLQGLGALHRYGFLSGEGETVSLGARAGELAAASNG